MRLTIELIRTGAIIWKSGGAETEEESIPQEDMAHRVTHAIGSDSPAAFTRD